MAEPLSPMEVTGISMLTSNAATQLDALAKGLVRRDLVDEVPRLQTTAVNAAKLARRALGNFVKRCGEASR
jgi:hypothetical protein